MAKVYVFVGPQGSGKGTQCKLLAKKLQEQGISILNISTGDALRSMDPNTEEGRIAHEKVKAGILVSEETLLKAVKEKVDKNREDCETHGFILDGIPRNLRQVQPVIDLAKNHEIVTVHIDISDEEAHRRLGGRWNCSKCGAIYNYQDQSQVKPCEKCGAKLGQRPDDTTERISRRLNTFHSETEPAIEKLKEYGPVHKIHVEPGTPVNEVRQRVWKAIGIE